MKKMNEIEKWNKRLKSLPIFEELVIEGLKKKEKAGQNEVKKAC